MWGRLRSHNDPVTGERMSCLDNNDLYDIHQMRGFARVCAVIVRAVGSMLMNDVNGVFVPRLANPSASAKFISFNLTFDLSAQYSQEKHSCHASHRRRACRHSSRVGKRWEQGFIRVEAYQHRLDRSQFSEFKSSGVKSSGLKSSGRSHSCLSHLGLSHCNLSHSSSL